jgi:iron(III) transport system substrate-binding protein
MGSIVRWAAVAAGLILAGAVGARADQTFDKAKQEKKAVWYTSIPLGTAQGLCNAFNAKKLGVECEVHRDGSGKLYSRWIQEAKSGIYTADVLHTSDLSHFIELKKLNALAAYRPRGTDKFNPAFWEKENYWGVLRASVYQPAYNTNKVKAEDVPKSWKDFLDPKWQGKLVNAHPSYSGVVSEGLGVLVDLLGWDFLDKLAAQKPRIVQSSVDTVTYVVRGEAVLSAGGNSSEVYNAIKKGEPIKAIYPVEGLPFIESPNAIMAKAPHPNAARVFTDWLFSTEAQQFMVNEGLYSGDPNVKYPADQVPLGKIKLLTISPDTAVKMDKPIKDRFRLKFGV